METSTRRKPWWQDQLHPHTSRGGLLVSWKNKLQILDFETGDRLEVRCASCGYTWYEEPVVYFHKSHIRQLYVDEFEAGMRCKQWNCSGKIVISQTHKDETEGFQGGLA